MADQTSAAPASLQVYRYTAGDDRVEAVIGTLEPELPQEDLVAHATEALERETFMCYAVSQPDDFVGDELCFVPQGDHCDILSIRTNGWQRHHGDHRRSLVEILNNIAAAVACGKLRILDPRPARERDVELGRLIVDFEIGGHHGAAAGAGGRGRRPPAGRPRRHQPPADDPLHLGGRDQHAAARRRSRPA